MRPLVTHVGTAGVTTQVGVYPAGTARSASAAPLLARTYPFLIRTAPY